MSTNQYWSANAVDLCGAFILRYIGSVPSLRTWGVFEVCGLQGRLRFGVVTRMRVILTGTLAWNLANRCRKRAVIRVYGLENSGSVKGVCMTVKKVSTLQRGAFVGLTAVFVMSCAAAAHADTWRKPKEAVEWAFKHGAVSVALEKCSMKKGPRYQELEINARDVPRTGEARTFEAGREQMLLLDGPDLTSLCGTALKFYGPYGADLRDVLQPVAAKE